jgi:hypothetical protein
VKLGKINESRTARWEQGRSSASRHSKRLAVTSANEKKRSTQYPLGAPRRVRYPNIVVLTEGSLGPSPGAHARNAELQLPFPSWIVTGKASMKRRRNGDSEFDGDLVDPSLGAPEPPQPSAPSSESSQPNGHAPVFVGGGEREARAYVPPTSLPAAAAPKQTADKVAISSSVDPRRMQTMRLAPGRPRPPLTPEEQAQERPGQMSEDAGSPSSRYPTSGSHVSQRPPKSPMASATIVRQPPSVGRSSSGTPTVVWVLAVALAALIGAATALWLRKSPATPAPGPQPPAASAAPAPTKR